MKLVRSLRGIHWKYIILVPILNIFVYHQIKIWKCGIPIDHGIQSIKWTVLLLYIYRHQRVAELHLTINSISLWFGIAVILGWKIHFWLDVWETKLILHRSTSYRPRSVKWFAIDLSSMAKFMTLLKAQNLLCVLYIAPILHGPNFIPQFRAFMEINCL